MSTPDKDGAPEAPAAATTRERLVRVLKPTINPLGGERDYSRANLRLLAQIAAQLQPGEQLKQDFFSQGDAFTEGEGSRNREPLEDALFALGFPKDGSVVDFAYQGQGSAEYDARTVAVRGGMDVKDLPPLERTFHVVIYKRS